MMYILVVLTIFKHFFSWSFKKKKSDVLILLEVRFRRFMISRWVDKTHFTLAPHHFENVEMSGVNSTHFRPHSPLETYGRHQRISFQWIRKVNRRKKDKSKTKLNWAGGLLAAHWIKQSQVSCLMFLYIQSKLYRFVKKELFKLKKRKSFRSVPLF